MTVQIGNKQFKVQVGRKELYNLSNFNSFNNLKPPSEPDNLFEFNELIQQIENAYGRQLSEGGCKKVL